MWKSEQRTRQSDLWTRQSDDGKENQYMYNVQVNQASGQDNQSSGKNNQNSGNDNKGRGLQSIRQLTRQ